MRSEKTLPSLNRDEAFVVLRRSWATGHSEIPADRKRTPSNEELLTVGVEDLVERGTNILLMNGSSARAYVYLDAAIVLRPTAEAFFARATASSNLGHPEASLKDLEIYLDRITDDPCAHALRGMDLQELGRFEEAIRAFSRAIELSSDHYLSRLGRGTCLLQLGRPEAALIDFDILSHYVDLESEYWSARADAYAALGMREEAEDCLRKSLAVEQALST